MRAPKTENPARASFNKAYTSCSLLKLTVSRTLLKPRALPPSLAPEAGDWIRLSPSSDSDKPASVLSKPFEDQNTDLPNSCLA